MAGRLHTSLPFSVDCGKGIEGTSEDSYVGKWERKARPIYVEHIDKCVAQASRSGKKERRWRKQLTKCNAD